MRALVLSGGGNKGAWQAGVIRRLLEDRGKYHIVCGVSVGALNGAFVAQHGSSQDPSKVGQALVDLWSSISQEDIYRRWFPFGRLHGLWKSSVYNSEPLRKLIQRHIDPESLKRSYSDFYTGAVDMESGTYRVFSGGEDCDVILSAIQASSAFPGFFEPVNIYGKLWCDGGVREITPLKTAITMGSTDIDVVVCTPEQGATTFGNNPNAIQVAERAIDLMGDEILNDDIEKAILANRLASLDRDSGYRPINLTIYRPSVHLPTNPLIFDSSLLSSMADQGYSDARYQVTVPG